MHIASTGFAVSRALLLSGTVLVFACGDCPTPPVLDPVLLTTGNPDPTLHCDTVYPYAHTEWWMRLADYDPVDTESIAAFEWTFPADTAISDSNDDSSVILVGVGTTSGEYCVTARMDCGERSNQACRTLTVVDAPVDTFVAQARNSDAIRRTRSTGAVVDGVGYYGLGDDRGRRLQDWWSWSWDTLMWARLADFPRLPSNEREVSFVAAGKIHVVRDDHYIYDPATNTWTAATPLDGGTAKGTLDLDGVSYVSDQAGRLWAYEPGNDSWTLSPTSLGDIAASFEIEGQAYVVGSGGGMLVGSPTTTWTTGSFAGCPLTAVYGGATVGTRGVVVGQGGGASWCVFEFGLGWTTSPQPAADDCSALRLYGARLGSVVWGQQDRLVYLGGRLDSGPQDEMGVVMLPD